MTDPTSAQTSHTDTEDKEEMLIENLHATETAMAKDCSDYCEVVIKDHSVVFRCGICLLSSFKSKCLIDNHILNVHLKNRKCTWCRTVFEEVEDIRDHCHNKRCDAGLYKELNRTCVTHSDSDDIEAMDGRMRTISEELSGENSISNEDISIVNLSSGEERLDKDSSDFASVTTVGKVVGKNISCLSSTKNSLASLRSKVKPHSKRATEVACPKCGQKFYDKFEVRRHLLYPNSCNTHRKQAINDPENISNLYSIAIDRSKKLKSYLYECLRCHRYYPSQYAVKRHIRRHHWGVKNYQCQVCKKGFFDVGVWKYHIQTPLRCRTKGVAIDAALVEDCLDVCDMDGDSDTITDVAGRVVVVKRGNAEFYTLIDSEAEKNTGKGYPLVVCKDQSNKSGSGQVVDCIKTDAKISSGVLDVDINGSSKTGELDNNLEQRQQGLLVPTSTALKNVDSMGKTVDMNSEMDTSEAAEDKVYRCRICSQIIDGTRNYVLHLENELKTHQQNRPHACTICEKKFGSKQNFRYHMNFAHMPKTGHKCLRCVAVFRRRHNLIVHILKQHSEVLPLASDTSAVNQTNDGFENTTLHYQKLLTMQGTDHDSKTNKKVVQIKKPSSVSVFKCNKCQVNFTDTAALLRHERKCIHGKYKCPKCKMSFGSFKLRADHVKQSHPADALVQCTVCCKHYRGEKRLKSHHRLCHTDRTLRYFCTFCSYKTWNKHWYKQHQYRHDPKSRELRFKCDVCDKVFDSSTALWRHKLTHAPTKNHVCNVCGKEFIQKCSLDRHLDSHKKLRKFKCAVCDKRYTQPFPLTKHVKSCHPDIFQQFQKERKTDKWKNFEPESATPHPRIIKPPLLKSSMTIVQLPKENKENDPKKQQFKYVIMDTSGKIDRSKEEDLVGSVMKAYDIQETSPVSTNPKPVVRQPKKKPTPPTPIFIVPGSRQNAIPQTDFKLVQPHQTSSKTVCKNSDSTETVLIPSIVLAAPMANPAPVVPTPHPAALPVDSVLLPDIKMDSSSKLTASATSTETQHTVPSSTAASNLFDIASGLPSEALDFYSPQMLGFQDVEEAVSGFSLQAGTEDFWFDFLQNSLDSNSQGLLGASGLAPLPPDAYIQDSAGYSTMLANTDVAETASVKASDAYEMKQETTFVPLDNNPVISAEGSVPRADSIVANVVLPTIDDVPNWAGEQLVLIQDENESYIISASNLAQLTSEVLETSGSIPAAGTSDRSSAAFQDGQSSISDLGQTTLSSVSSSHQEESVVVTSFSVDPLEQEVIVLPGDHVGQDNAGYLGEVVDEKSATASSKGECLMSLLLKR